MRGLLGVVALAAVTMPGWGQAPPPTDVYLVSIKRQGSGFAVGDPKNLTHRAGFDNQPSFTPDGKSLLYTVVRPGGPNGTDRKSVV